MQLSGYLLHSSIPALSSEQHAADIGTGTRYVSSKDRPVRRMFRWQTTSYSCLRCFTDLCYETRIWLIELSRDLSDTVTLDGFDISPAQYPPRALLPKLINLHTHTALAPFPQEFLGKYDVVNLRFLITVLDRDRFGTLLGSLTSLLSKY